MDTFTVAAVQASPVFLDRDATVNKACALIKEAAAAGARLVVFPETFVPTYPDWVWRQTPWSDDRWWTRLQSESVVVPDAATDQVAAAAGEARTYVALGINEREPHGSTLYNTLLYFSADGALLGKHRKLVPTGPERLAWGMGDGSTLEVFDTDIGRIGGLICWENYMALARYALYAQGLDVYLAPTWDNSETWTASMRHIAKEGRVYVIGVAPCLRGSDVPPSLPGRDELYGGDDDWMSTGRSVIVDPSGDVLAGPLIGEEGILYAEVDVDAARAIRHQFDPVGHYARPDVFELSVNTAPRAAATFGKGHPPA